MDRITEKRKAAVVKNHPSSRTDMQLNFTETSNIQVSEVAGQTDLTRRNLQNQKELAKELTSSHNDLLSAEYDNVSIMSLDKQSGTTLAAIEDKKLVETDTLNSSPPQEGTIKNKMEFLSLLKSAVDTSVKTKEVAGKALKTLQPPVKRICYCCENEILTEKALRAMDNDWHEKCFTCSGKSVSC